MIMRIKGKQWMLIGAVVAIGAVGYFSFSEKQASSKQIEGYNEPENQVKPLGFSLTKRFLLEIRILLQQPLIHHMGNQDIVVIFQWDHH